MIMDDLGLYFPLADIQLYNDRVEELYCLCSRVFVSAFEENRDEEINDYSQEIPDEKQEVDQELSCYGSAAASHTDNISTDEHESIKDSNAFQTTVAKTIPASDSGADLNFYVANECDQAWQKYWAENGEQIIWKSWIAKYSEYINPDYLQAHSLQIFSETQPINNEHKKITEQKGTEVLPKADVSDCSINVHKIDKNEIISELDYNKKIEIAQRNSILIRNLSGSDSTDKLVISEGWNPLSPTSADGENETERLLNSRCGSHASSSVRTVDSLTNVTRMTVSSVDLSDSSKTTDSISSVSSVQSSLSSTSSDENDDNTDYQHQWNILWKQHYEQEYYEHYNKFIITNKENSDGKLHGFSFDKTSDKTPTAEQGHFGESVREFVEGENSSVKNKTQKKKGYVKRNKNKGTNCLTKASKHYSDVKQNNTDDNISTLSYFVKEINLDHTKDSEKSNADQSYSYEKEIYRKLQNAFKLMVLEFNQENREKYKGIIEYKMEHIHLQNREVNLHYRYYQKMKPTHLRFDDDLVATLVDNNDTDTSNTIHSKQSTSAEDDEVLDSEPNSCETVAYVNSDHETKKKKCKRKRKSSYPIEVKANPKLRKYYAKRFLLFKKFDEGVILDEESWYSVTPESLAAYTAERCRCDLIVDAFCGAGGNAIQFAFVCERVIAIDIDPKKIEMARHNAEIYGVADRIEFICGDFIQLAPTLKAEVVFLSPPWGGPSYLDMETYDLEAMLQPLPLSKLLTAARHITEDIAIYLPKNSNVYDLYQQATTGHIEIEQNFIDNRLVAITAYYNYLVRDDYDCKQLDF